MQVAHNCSYLLFAAPLRLVPPQTISCLFRLKCAYASIGFSLVRWRLGRLGSRVYLILSGRHTWTQYIIRFGGHRRIHRCGRPYSYFHANCCYCLAFYNPYLMLCIVHVVRLPCIFSLFAMSRVCDLFVYGCMFLFLFGVTRQRFRVTRQGLHFEWQWQQTQINS